MKIVLTGGTGFIGSHFLKQALAQNHTVLAIRRSPASQPRILLDQQPIWLDRDLNSVTSRDLDGFDVLVHLAAHTGNVPYDSTLNCVRWNLVAVLELFEQALKSGIKRFIVAGSCFEYGRSGERYSEIPTDAPLEPTNSYAASKAAASIVLRQWADEHMVSLEILRVFHVYGEGEPESRFWPSLRRAALAGNNLSMTQGEQIRDFQPVDAVASAFLERATSHASLHVSSVFNLGSSSPLSISQFAQKWWKAFHATGQLLLGELPYRDNEVMRYVPKPDILLPQDAPSARNIPDSLDT